MLKRLPVIAIVILIGAGCAEQPLQAPVPTTLSYQLPVIAPAEGVAFLQKQGGVSAEVKPVTYSPQVRYKVSLHLDPHVGQDILASVGGQNVTTYAVTFTPFVIVTPNALAVTLTITNNDPTSDLDSSSPPAIFVGFLDSHKEEDIGLTNFQGVIASHTSKSDIASYSAATNGEDISKPGSLMLQVVGMRSIPKASGQVSRTYNFGWRMTYSTQPQQLVASTITRQIQMSDAQAENLKGGVVVSPDNWKCVSHPPIAVYLCASN